MPADDVSDLRDVVDAINKLCDTMKSSYDAGEDGADFLHEVDEEPVAPTAIVVRKVEIHVAERWCEPDDDESACFYSEPAATEPEAYDSEPATIVPAAFDSEPAVFESEPAQCEPTSEMYYTASSEVSLLSEADLQDRAQSEDSDRDRDDRNSVMAGHVAAMRERFESMTRTNTPCPDLIRSTSPSFEVFRNISASPDFEKS